MKISTKGRYALRMMVDLAEHQNGEYISLKDIALRQEVSKKYLEQIVPILNKSGFLKTNRGYQGGYMLAKTPEDITVGAVLRVLEGSLCPVDCVDGAGDCPRMARCATIGVWTRLKEAVESVVDHTTLADLAEEFRLKNPPDYSI